MADIFYDRNGKPHLRPAEKHATHRKGAFGALLHQNHILLTWGPHAPHVGELPGGGIDEGETPAAAFIRETYEETGVTLPAILATQLASFYEQDVNFYAEDGGEYWHYHQTYFTYRNCAPLFFEGKQATPEGGVAGWVKLSDLTKIPFHVPNLQALKAMEIID